MTDNSAVGIRIGHPRRGLILRFALGSYAAECSQFRGVDAGMARTLTTTTANADVYAFVFGQKGLMAGAGLQGTKITRIAQ